MRGGGRAVAILASVAVLVGASSTGRQPAPEGDGERQAILDAQSAAIEARRASLHPPTPDHPALAETMTGAALEGFGRYAEFAVSDPSDAFVFDPPVEHKPLAVEVEEIDGAQVAFVIDCQLSQGQVAVGASFEPGPDPDPAHRTTALGVDLLTKVGGRWKLGLSLPMTRGERAPQGCMTD